MIVGIDPAPRNVGVCIINDGADPIDFYTASTKDIPLLETGRVLREEFAKLFKTYPDAIFSVEKMMPTARCGAQLFYIQMILLEEMDKWTSRKLVHLLPIQLKSYIAKLTGSVPSTGTELVARAKGLMNFNGRVSSHVADAYFLARAGLEVKNGQFQYNLSKSELPLTNWRILGGK